MGLHLSMDKWELGSKENYASIFGCQSSSFTSRKQAGVLLAERGSSCERNSRIAKYRFSIGACSERVLSVGLLG